MINTPTWFCCGAQQRRGDALAALLISTVAILSLPAAPSAQGNLPPPVGSVAGGYAGLWYDDTGQGVVEIQPCSERLCGRIVWLQAPRDKTGKPLTDGNNPDTRLRNRSICGLPVLGDLKRQRDGSWDAGWVYDPKQGKQFDVALQLKNSDALVVTGYLGIKLLSETFLWKRAPANLGRC